MKTKNLIRSIYIYLATFIGLMMIVIPVVDMLKLSLETWVFPLAQEDRYDYRDKAPEPYMLEMLDEGAIEKNTRLSEDDKAALKDWKEDYRAWQEKQERIDWKTVEMQQDLVRDISTLLVGLALFLTHGAVLRRDKKKGKA